MKTTVKTNLEAVGDFIGYLRGVRDGLDDEEYMDSILREAHGKAADAFDLTAAATAKTGTLTHMFEYGTAGITEGATKYPVPTAPEARLWVHNVTSGKGQINANFTFRPAVNRNPPHTVKSTGVSSQYLRKLSRRKYVFWNRAFMMESGRNVKIVAKNNDALFIHFNGKPARNPKYRDKGFVWWNTEKKGAIDTQVGMKHKGTFTAFWTGWWTANGENMINTEVAQNINRDVLVAEMQMEREARKQAMKSVVFTDVKNAAKKAEKISEDRFGDSTNESK